MKRLVKKSLMNPEVFKGSLDQLGKQGREILKLIEDYKFKLEQTCRLTANDQVLTQKLIQKKKQLDAASGQIYSIVFDVENIDITQAFEQQQINTNPSGPSNSPTQTPEQNQHNNPASQNSSNLESEHENDKKENDDSKEINKPEDESKDDVEEESKEDNK